MDRPLPLPPFLKKFTKDKFSGPFFPDLRARNPVSNFLDASVNFLRMCVCVLPIGRSILKVSFLWSSSLQIGVIKELPFLIMCSIPVLNLPGGLLPSTLPSITRGRRSPLRNVCPSQALCLLMVDIID